MPIAIVELVDAEIVVSVEGAELLEPLVTTATNAATLSQAWAESATAPAGGSTKSSKTWAGEAAQSAAYAGGFETPEYASQAAGEAATTAGDIFRVPLGTTPQTFNWFRRLSSGSEAVSPLATSGALAASGGSALVGYTPGGASAEARTTQAKLREARSTSDKAGNLSAELTAWITDLTAASGGKISIPAGSHTMTSGVVMTNGYHLEGDGRFKTIIDPNFSGTVFRLSGGTGVTPYQNRIAGFGFFSPAAGNRILFHVRNGANNEISRISMPEGGIPGAGSIGILHEGRELNWYHDNIWSIAKPMRILPNPEASALDITTDYLVCEREHYIAQVATEACVESTGAYISNANWRNCALVKGAEGIKLVNTTLATASHNVRIVGCRREQAQTASAYGFHFDFSGSGGQLQNLTMESCHTSSAQNGLYGRGVRHALIQNMVFTQGAGKTSIDWDIPAGGSLTLDQCYGQTGGTKTITNGHCVLRVPSIVASQPIGSLEHWVRFVTPVDPGAGGLINYDALPFINIGGVEVASWEMTVPTGSRTIRFPLLPANVAGADPVGAEVFIRSKTGYFRAYYPADGSNPTIIEATGPFALTATSNRIYAAGYPNGVISNSLSAAEVIRVEVRK